MGRNGFSGWILESWEGRKRAMGKANQGGLQGLCAQTSGRPRRRAVGDVVGALESLRMTECRIPMGGVKTCSSVLASFLAVFTPQFSITQTARFKFICPTPEKWKTEQLPTVESLGHLCPGRF